MDPKNAEGSLRLCLLEAFKDERKKGIVLVNNLGLNQRSADLDASVLLQHPEKKYPATKTTDNSIKHPTHPTLDAFSVHPHPALWC